MKISPDTKFGFYLESIGEKDLENLRVWKNNNRKRFFFQEIINPDQQKKWFQQYKKKEKDFIFMIRCNEGKDIGCLGYRVEDDEIDIYNVMRGETGNRNIAIHDAMHFMITYIMQNYNMPIKCDVLKDNPAVNWYGKCGFAIREEREYYVMELRKDKIPEVNIRIEEDYEL